MATQKAIKDQIKDVSSTLDQAKAELLSERQRAETEYASAMHGIDYFKRSLADLQGKEAEIMELRRMSAHMPAELREKLSSLSDAEEILAVAFTEANAGLEERQDKAAKNAYVQWIQAEKEAVAQAKAKKAAYYADLRVRAKARLAAMKANIAEKAKKAAEKHAQDVKTALDQMAAGNKKAQADARKSGVRAEWVSKGAEMVAEAVRQAHQAHNRTPSPDEVVDKLAEMLEDEINFADCGFEKSRMVGDELVIDAYFASMVRYLAIEADKAGKPARPVAAPVVRNDAPRTFRPKGEKPPTKTSSQPKLSNRDKQFANWDGKGS